MDRFRTCFLEGRLCDADIALHQAVDIYAKTDDMCSIADAYTQQFLFYAYIDIQKDELLQKAEEFAFIDDCAAEKRRIDALRSIPVGSNISSETGDAPNDIYRSVMLRKAALGQKDRGLIHEALTIDRKHNWTLFIVRDLAILETLTDDGAEKEKIKKRIDFLSRYIQDCE